MLLGPVSAPLLRRYLFPNAATQRAPRSDEHEFEIRGVTLRGRVANPDRDRAAIYLGGNGEDAAGWIKRFTLAAPDVTTYLVNYRGYGASDRPRNGIASARTLIADSVALLDLIGSRHPSAPVSLVGRSIGSGIAMQVAAQRPVARIALSTPFDSLSSVAADVAHVPRWLAAALIPDHLDSVSAVRHVDVPVLVLRAGLDTLVRPAHTKALVDALLRHQVPTTEIVFPEADHRSIGQDVAHWEAIGRFISVSSPEARPI